MPFFTFSPASLRLTFGALVLFPGENRREESEIDEFYAQALRASVQGLSARNTAGAQRLSADHGGHPVLVEADSESGRTRPNAGRRIFPPILLSIFTCFSERLLLVGVGNGFIFVFAGEYSLKRMSCLVVASLSNRKQCLTN